MFYYFYIDRTANINNKEAATTIHHANNDPQYTSEIGSGKTASGKKDNVKPSSFLIINIDGAVSVDIFKNISPTHIPQTGIQV